MELDRNGYLWVGTGEGLNRFDGKTVEKYFTSEFPALQNDFIRQIVCDKNNWLWVLTDQGNLTIIDDRRHFHRVGLFQDNKFQPTRRLLKTDRYGILLLMRGNHLALKPEVDILSQDSLDWQDFEVLSMGESDSLFRKSFSYIHPGDKDQYFFSTKDTIYAVDYDKCRLDKTYACKDCKLLGLWQKNSFLVYKLTDNIVEAINLTTDERRHPFISSFDQDHLPFNSYIQSIHTIAPKHYIITTRDDGVYFHFANFDQVFNLRHDAADPTTIVNDSPSLIIGDSTGWVFLSATPNGISYFNFQAVIGQKLIFQDKKGHSYDGYIVNLTTQDNDTYYIGTSDYMIEWNRSQNLSTFYEFPLPQEKSKVRQDEVLYVTFDRFGHLWVATLSSGIYVLDQRKNLLHHFKEGLQDPKSPLSARINHINELPDGRMWVSSGKGICALDPVRFTVHDLKGSPIEDLRDEPTFRIETYDSKDVWICTNTKGVWQYQPATGQITKYDKNSGLLSNQVIVFNKDTFNNLYFGTALGLSIRLQDGTFKTITDTDGLLNKRIEALLLDKSNRMWIGNDVGIACFNIRDTSIRVFDERYGLSIQGFRTNAYHQNKNDELVWGTERGLQYFFPNDLINQKIEVKTIIHRIQCRDLDSYLSQTETFDLAPRNTFITFSFSTIDYSTHLRTFYQYQLEGLEEGWIDITNQNSVRYNSLKPGDYVFRVRASNDKKNWVPAENEIHFHLQARIYETAWFRILLIAAVLFLISYIFAAINRRQKKRTEALETEIVIHYFASQINRHKQEDEMLWDLAKNLISRLKLEECVIYIVDSARKVLVQKAAYGPKNPKDVTILQPIEIPIGQGITGSVAKTQKAEIVSNTEKDPRYIVDDQRRYSEITVPMIVDGQVIGVIDSEHSQKNFFTQKHMNLLTAIAVLSANQIQRIRAEQEKQKALIEVLQNKQKATESRLQSLRLQMNPHFLFNALNSIQQMILANEEMVATRYLSRFSKLLRSILIHSDKETISLKEELDILKLYVELESVRFKEAFSYEIDCDEDIDTDEVKIPTLLIQPFVENAIWHGLMHKEGHRKLKISFKDKGEFVECIVEDNGIGRAKAREMKITSGQDKKHTSKGIAVSLERLHALEKNGSKSGSMQIIDLMDAKGHALGTRVEIHLPIQN